MAYDVFISYSRTDIAFCTKVFRLLERLGFHPFRDVDGLAGGAPWQEQLQEALKQPDLQPAVLVLCTRAAVERPEGVVEEVRLARGHGLPVIPVEVDPGAAKHLLAAAGFEHPGQIHYIAVATDSSGRPVVDERLEDDLRRTLTRKVSRWLAEQRALAKTWADLLRQDTPFWETTWRDYFPLAEDGRLSGSVVLTARGGSGKSVLIAHCVRSLLEDPEVYPVLIDEDTLRDPLRLLARRLGARPSAAELTKQVEALAVQPPGEHRGWKPMRVVFVVDGLDRMVTPDDKFQTKLVNGLNLLINAAPVLIGCRKEVWDSWYAGKVSVSEEPVPELGERQVQAVLRGTRLAGQFNPLLRIPFFLDVAASRTGNRTGSWPTLPRTETEFLHRIWSEAVTESPSPGEMMPSDSGRAWILEALAACQLQQLVYDVALDDLRNRPGWLPAYEEGLHELEKEGLLVKSPRDGRPTVRLRHDLLDNYSMARNLLKKDKLDKCRELCRRCEKDCGWSLLASLVQLAHDNEDEKLARALFSEFLFLMDHKKFGDEAMSRAWAVTHVLISCFKPSFGLICEALKGTPVESLNKKDPTDAGRYASCLGPSALLTQEAVSTLASVFKALRPDLLLDAEAAVPLLAGGLRVWRLKARIVEALARFHSDAALEAVVSYTRLQMQHRDDPKSLRYVAQSLRHFPQAAASSLLREMIADTALKSVIRRLAAESLAHLYPGEVEVPQPDEDEIVEGLDIHDESGSYSDWQIVQDYAAEVHRRMARGERFSRRVLEALIAALKHDQTFARRAVAQALTLFDEPDARDALLDELLEPVVPAEVRSACLAALDWKLGQLAEPRDRQAFLYLLLRAAQAARQSGADLVERGLSDLALRRTGDWSLTPDAVEVLPPPATPWTVRCSVAEAEIDPAVLRELAGIPAQDVGPDREPKYLFAGFQAAGGGLDVVLAPTTWRLGKSFHNAVRDDPGRFLRAGRSWLVPMPLGPARLPGLAVVHGIVLTSDGRLLLAQRSETLAYAPLHWSISFEEQITEGDLRGGDRALHLAASRGLLEEFGIAADPARIHLLSAVLEMDNLNLAAVVLIETAETLDGIRGRWSSEPRPTHAWEARALDGIEADPVRLEALARGADSSREPLHPTSRMRCALLARWLRG